MVSIHGSAKTLDAFRIVKGLVLKSFKHEHWENNYGYLYHTENKRNRRKVRLLNRQIVGKTLKKFHELFFWQGKAKIP
jgi:hypothetical protein